MHRAVQFDGWLLHGRQCAGEGVVGVRGKATQRRRQVDRGIR
jgi:hypothetical protein